MIGVNMPRRRLVLLLVAAIACTAAERDVAEWVIRSGGRVILEGSRAPVGDLLSLPNGELSIRGIDLYGSLIDPTELEKLSGLTGLKELYLPGPSWNPGAGSCLDANEQL